MFELFNLSLDCFKFCDPILIKLWDNLNPTFLKSLYHLNILLKKLPRFLTIYKVGLGLSCPPRQPNPPVPTEHRGRPLPSDNLLMTILSLQNMTAIIYGMMERFKIIFESFLINNHQRKLLTVDPFGLLFIGNL